MSRSGYNEDMCDEWGLIRWRGQVASAIRGKRGQAFLRELVASLDAMPIKALIPEHLQRQDPHLPAEGTYCALGAVGRRRQIDMTRLDPEDHAGLAGVFGIAHQLVQEIEYMNDEGRCRASPEERWAYMRAWAVKQIKGGV